MPVQMHMSMCRLGEADMVNQAAFYSQMRYLKAEQKLDTLAAGVENSNTCDGSR
jgi:cytochrome c553